MSIVVKSSKAEQNVLTCGLENLNFTSSQNLFKLYDYGSWELEFPGGGLWETLTVEIYHDLGYKPGFSVIGEIPHGLGGTSGRYTKYVYYVSIGAYADSEKLTIFAGSDEAETTHGYYAIYLDSLE